MFPFRGAPHSRVFLIMSSPTSQLGLHDLLRCPPRSNGAGFYRRLRGGHMPCPRVPVSVLRCFVPTNRQHKNEYQGFARYTDEYRSSPAAQQQQAAARTKSLASASQAAAAALQLHSKPTGLQPPNPGARRTASLTAASGHHSMRSYTYNPKPSYHAGPAPPRAGPSMRANSLGLRTNSMNRQFSRAGAQNAAHLRHAPYYAVPEEESHDEESVVITTKTTKVVDAYGRTTSVTLETIRKLADGSNIIETKTTNISRPTSRSNSFRANSLSQAPPGANYNLDKIDEDLHDFDYTYLDHADASPPRLNYLEPTAASPKTDRYLQEQRKALLGQSPPKKQDDRNASIVSSQSNKRLKSILKSSPAVAEDNPSEAYSADQGGLRRLDPSPYLKSTQMSNASGTSTSIKFQETVETISYPSEQHNVAVLHKEMLAHEEQEKKKNVDLYAQAMKVAMQKVYGDSAGNALETPPASPLLRQGESPATDVGDLAAKKIKKDHKREHVELGGVNKNYIYENHHKDFAIRSLRGGDPTDTSTRKKRVKEEMKLHKEEEKRQAELLKNAQKEKKRQEKTVKKDKKKKHLNLFGFSKRKNSIGESVLSTVGLAVTGALAATISTSFLDHSDGQIHSIENGSPRIAPQDTLDSSDYDDTREHFVDVPDVIEEDEEEQTRVRPSILHENYPGSPAEGNDAVEHPSNGNVASKTQVSPDIVVGHTSTNSTGDSGVLLTLVSSPNGHPRVLSNSSRNARRNEENDIPSPNLEMASPSLDDRDIISPQPPVELDSHHELSPKQKHRETAVVGPDSSPDSPTIQPQILLFEPQGLSILAAKDGLSGSDQAVGEEVPVGESLAGSLSTVDPPLESLDDSESSQTTAADGGQLSSPFVLNGKRQPVDYEEKPVAASSPDRTEPIDPEVNTQKYIPEGDIPAVNEQKKNEAASLLQDRSGTPMIGEISTDADFSGVTAQEHLDDRMAPEVVADHETTQKKVKVKKASKFKKMIDKYFINGYSK